MAKSLMEEINDRKLQEVLNDGESVQWQGRAEPFSLTGGKNKKKYLTRCLISAVCFIVITAAYALLVSSSERANFSYVLVAVVAVVCLYVALLPKIDARKVMKKCSYYITDQRYIEIIDSKEVLALPRKDVNVKVMDAEDGCITIALGAAVGKPEKKYLVATIAGVKDSDTEKTIGVVFYNVKDGKRLRELLGK